MNCDCRALPFYNWTASGNGSLIADKEEISCAAAAEDKWVSLSVLLLHDYQFLPLNPPMSTWARSPHILCSK